jgi:hypothetical protein
VNTMPRSATLRSLDGRMGGRRPRRVEQSPETVATLAPERIHPFRSVR